MEINILLKSFTSGVSLFDRKNMLMNEDTLCVFIITLQFLQKNLKKNSLIECI